MKIQLKLYNFKSKKGYALATVLILLGVALFGMGSIVTISTLESKISRSQQEGITAYQIAEAGAQDGLWRIKNDSGLSTDLLNGTLNHSYEIMSFFGAGRKASVSMTPDAEDGRGYGYIEATGEADNGYFNAVRKIKIKVFQGSTSSVIDDSGIFSGSDLSITNGNAKLKITNGNLYSKTGIKINSAEVDLGPGKINTPGDYSTNNSNVIASEVHSSNIPIAAQNIDSPGVDFVGYSNNSTVKYTPTQISNLFRQSSTVTLPGPVTYISGSLSASNYWRNKVLNITGLLVVDGSFVVNSSAGGLTVNVYDSGTGPSGILVKSNFTISTGIWNINGLLYSGGNISGNISQAITINGAMVAAGSVSLNTGAQLTINYQSGNVSDILGYGTPTALEVKHWEESY